MIEIEKHMCWQRIFRNRKQYTHWIYCTVTFCSRIHENVKICTVQIGMTEWLNDISIYAISVGWRQRHGIYFSLIFRSIIIQIRINFPFFSFGKQFGFHLKISIFIHKEEIIEKSKINNPIEYSNQIFGYN